MQTSNAESVAQHSPGLADRVGQPWAAMHNPYGVGCRGIGIGLGLAILTLLGVFEKKRKEVQLLLDEFRHWEP
jgi:hypothetical protein